MKKEQHLPNMVVITTAIAAAIATLYANTWLGKSTPSASTERERCYGIAGAGNNDCATSKHACAAKANSDRDPHEWIMVPKGLCTRIMGSHND